MAPRITQDGADANTQPGGLAAYAAVGIAGAVLGPYELLKATRMNTMSKGLLPALLRTVRWLGSARSQITREVLRSTASRKATAITTAALMALGATGVHAQLVYWDGPNLSANSVVNGGSSTWNTTRTNWTNSAGTTNGAWPGGSNVAIFGATAGTVTVSGSPSIGGMQFATTGYKITSATNLGTTGLTLSGATTVTVPAGMTVDILAPINGSGSLTFTGGGTVNLTQQSGNTNYFSGGLTVDSGTVNVTQLNSTCPAGRSAVGTGALTISAGAQMALVGSSDNYLGCLWASASNSVSSVALAGTLTMDASSSANLPPITMNGGVLATFGSSVNTTWATFATGYPITVNANSTISAANLLNATTGGTAYNVSSGVTLTVSGYFGLGTSSPDTGFILGGGGDIVFSGPDNTATGPITVNNGTLRVGAGGTTGSIASHSGVALSSTSAKLVFNRSNAYSFGKVISGSGNVSQIGSGTTTLTAANTYSGSTTVSAGTLQIGGSGSLGSSGTYAGAISNAGTFQYSSSANQTLSGAISGGGALTKDTGTSTLTLSGSNSYTGATTVNAGTLQAGVADTAFGTNSAVTVASGATLNIPNGYTETIGSLAGDGSVTAQLAGTILTTGALGTST